VAVGRRSTLASAEIAGGRGIERYNPFDDAAFDCRARAVP
jgi:hypothetical protein